MAETDSLRATVHNLGLYRLEGFSGRRAHLLQLHEWMTGADDLAAIAISGEQGVGKSTLATAAAWNLYHHFEDGIVRVGAAGVNRFRIYDIVRTMDTVFGTTLTRFSEERWGLGILEQLFRRKRLLILDELSGATPDDLETLADIMGHLHEAGGNSRIMLIDRNFSPAIAELVSFQHIHLEGLTLDEMGGFIQQRAPEAARSRALDAVAELHAFTHGHPYLLRIILGLLIDYSWRDLAGFLATTSSTGGLPEIGEIVAFAVENFAVGEPQTGPLLDRLVSAAGGASLAALHELFWSDLGSADELSALIDAMQDRALLERDPYGQRVVMHPIVRRYMEQNAVMLGEEWDRRHAHYYVSLVERYQGTALNRWPEIDAEWGNIYKGADWCTERVQRLWQEPAMEILAKGTVDQDGLTLPPEAREFLDDLRLTRRYGLALAHYSFWRHPPGSLRWLSSGGVAAAALADARNYGWLIMNIGRQLFFTGAVEQAVAWFKRAANIFDTRDLLTELAYAFTDLGTSYRILDRQRQALAYFRGAYECVAQTGDQEGLATAHMNLGSAYYGLDDFEDALQEYRKALRIAIRHNNVQQSASAFNSMGLAMEGLDRLEEAQLAYEQSLELFRKVNDSLGISTCYNNLGSVAYGRGNFDLALMWYELDLALSETRGAWTDMAATLHNLGHVAMEQGAHARAEAYFEQSRDIYAAFQLVDYVEEESKMIEYLRTLEREAM